jgi:hypothetical protein
MPAFPADRNATTELAGTGAALGTIAGAGYNAYNQYSPQYTNTNVTNMNNALRGDFNQVAYDRANPGVLAEFQKQQAGGELGGWKFADFAAANAGLSSNDSSLNQYYTNSLGSNLRTAYDQANPQQNAANNQLAADRDRLNGQTIPGVQTNTAQFTGSQGLPGVQTNAATYTGAQGSNAQFTPGQARATDARYNAAQGGPLGGALQMDAARNLGQVSGLQSQLQQQASSLLGAGGGLTQGETMAAQQSARAAYADRGRLRGNAGIGAEILGTDQAQRARLMQNAQFAQGVDASGQQQLNQNRGYAQGVQAQNQGLSQFNAGQQNQLGQFNAGQRTGISQFNTGQANQIGASLAQFNAGQNQQNSQFNATGMNAMNQSAAERADANARFNYQGQMQNQQFNASGLNAMNQDAASRGDANARFNYQGQMQNQQFNAAGMNAMNQDAASRADANARYNLSNATQNNQFNASQANDLARFNYTGANQNNQYNSSGINAMNQDAAARGDANARFNYSGAAENNRFNAGQSNDLARFNYSGAAENNRFNAAGINAINQDAAARADANARFNYQGQMQQGNDQFGRSQSVAGQYGTQAINPGTYAAQLAQGTPDYTGQTLNYMGDLNSTNYNAAASRYNSAQNNKAATTGAIINGVASLGSAFICWVAREVYGKDDPQWRRFRGWMLTGASDRLLAWYLATGERAARTVRGNQHLRAQLRTSMDARLATLAT